MSVDLEKLRGIQVFSALSQPNLEQVASIIQVRDYTKDDIIFNEGDDDARLFMIASGAVRIVKHIPGIGQEALAILKPGQHFGEMAIIDEQPRSADAVAHVDSTLWVIERDRFENLLFMNKELAYDVLWSFVRTLSVRLRETNDKLAAFFAMTGRF